MIYLRYLKRISKSANLSIVFWQILYHIYEPYSLDLGDHTLELEYSYYNGAEPYREQIIIGPYYREFSVIN